MMRHGAFVSIVVATIIFDMLVMSRSITTSVVDVEVIYERKFLMM